MCLHLLSACCLCVCACVFVCAYVSLWACAVALKLQELVLSSYHVDPGVRPRLSVRLGDDKRCYPLSHGSVTFYEVVGIEGFLHTFEALCAKLRAHENPQCLTDVTIPLRPRYSHISTRA